MRGFGKGNQGQGQPQQQGQSQGQAKKPWYGSKRRLTANFLMAATFVDLTFNKGQAVGAILSVANADLGDAWRAVGELTTWTKDGVFEGVGALISGVAEAYRQGNFSPNP